VSDERNFPQSHRRRLTITGIDDLGDVWSFSTDDIVRADAAEQQMKERYHNVTCVEDADIP
jgi:hypothetical protein